MLSAFLRALWWVTKSEKHLCAMFPSASCPCWVWALVSLLPGTSPGKQIPFICLFVCLFIDLHSIQKKIDGFLYPLYLDYQGARW